MSIARNRRDNDRELERRITAVKALDSSRYKSIPTLHFEGSSDRGLVHDFVNNNQGLKKISSEIDFVHSLGKRFAIKHHIEAMGLGFKISTIVDMDHDFKDRDFSNKISKGSQNEYIKHSNIRSTNPCCVLLTLLLEEALEEAVKRVPILKDPTEDEIRIILDCASERSIERVFGFKDWMDKVRYERDKKVFLKKIPNPINDHSLCESIYLHRSGTYQEEADDWEWRSVEEEIRYAIQESLADSAKELGSKILEELVISMIEETSHSTHVES